MHDCIIVCEKKKKKTKTGVTMDASLIIHEYEVVFLFVGKAKEVNVTIKTTEIQIEVLGFFYRLGMVFIFFSLAFFFD